MEFIVSTSDLLSQLNIVKGVINSKNTLPILDNFLFKLEGNTLKIAASDLETTLNTQMELKNAKGKGIIAIEAKRLTDLLKEFTDPPLTFKLIKKIIKLIYFRQVVNLQLLVRMVTNFLNYHNLKRSFHLFLFSPNIFKKVLQVPCLLPATMKCDL
jgi:DNA polymerase III sliding clamp (beta) subunit (PCNA family)